MKNVITPLAKSALKPLGLKAAVLSTDEGIHKKIIGLGTIRLIISNKERKDIKKVKFLENLID